MIDSQTAQIASSQELPRFKQHRQLTKEIFIALIQAERKINLHAYAPSELKAHFEDMLSMAKLASKVYHDS